MAAWTPMRRDPGAAPGSANDAGDVTLGVAPEVAGEDLRLEERQLADADRGAEERVPQLVTLAGYVRLEERLACVAVQRDAATVAADEVGGGDLSPVQQGEHQAVGHEGPELLDEVQ